MKEVLKTFEQYVKDEVLIAEGIPVVWHNVRMDTPVGEHVRPFLNIGGDTRNSSLGTKSKEERVCEGVFKIYTTDGKGNARAMEIGNKIAGAFRDQTLTVQATIAGSGGGISVDGSNKKTKLLSGTMRVDSFKGPEPIPDEENLVVHILRVIMIANLVYGIDS